MTNLKNVKTVDLSIDFDFFVRELVEWDWGHGETAGHFYATALWQIRYSGSLFDIYEETDPAKHADVPPNAYFFAALREKGLGFDKARGRRFGLAESHKEAFQFFTKKNVPADYVVNIDAHHDVYTSAEKPLDCGNWLSHLHQKWPHTKIIQVYPKWQQIGKKVGDCEISGVPLHITRWADFTFPKGAKLRNIFICRSGAWTPPHLDQMFVRLCQTVMMPMNRTPVMLDKIIVRDEFVVPHAEHSRLSAEYRSKMEQLRGINLKRPQKTESEP